MEEKPLGAVLLLFRCPCHAEIQLNAHAFDANLTGCSLMEWNRVYEKLEEQGWVCHKETWLCASCGVIHLVPNELTQTQREVLEFFRKQYTPEDVIGLAFPQIYDSLRHLPTSVIDSAIQKLVEEGLIYSTIDDSHFVFTSLM